MISRLNAVLLPVSLAALLATAGCAAGAPSAPPDAAPSAAAAVLADPATFAATVADSRTFTINVHIPDAGSIAGTDAAIPFDAIAGNAAKLPQDRATPLAVYCLTGRMSAAAVPELAALGYTNITELRGGMDAWAASGRELLPPSG